MPWPGLTANSASWVQVILLPQPTQSSWDYRRKSRSPANFVFLVEMGFLHIGQAGLKLPTSGNPPTSAFQSPGITGMSHPTGPNFFYFCTDEVSVCCPCWSGTPVLKTYFHLIPKMLWLQVLAMMPSLWPFIINCQLPGLPLLSPSLIAALFSSVALLLTSSFCFIYFNVCLSLL